MLYRPDIAGIGHARQLGIGAVGVDDTPLLIGDNRALGKRIDKGARQFIAGAARCELDDIDGRTEKIEHASHGQRAEQSQQELLPQLVAIDEIKDGNADQHNAENDKTQGRLDRLCVRNDRFWIKIVVRLLRHPSQTPSFHRGSCPGRPQYFEPAEVRMTNAGSESFGSYL